MAVSYLLEEDMVILASAKSFLFTLYVWLNRICLQILTILQSRGIPYRNEQKQLSHQAQIFTGGCYGIALGMGLYRSQCCGCTWRRHIRTSFTLVSAGNKRNKNEVMWVLRQLRNLSWYSGSPVTYCAAECSLLFSVSPVRIYLPQ